MILETRRRLSQSHLWRLQRRFFSERGPRAWSEGIVPHYISSNPFLARSYVRLVLGFLRDLAPALDPGQPLHVVELGAGAGRLGYHFLEQLRPALGLPLLSGPGLRYVMTDFADSLVAPLREHPRLAPWVAEGRLDFARFDAEAPEPLQLQVSGAVLGPEPTANPLIVIANYVFDSLPQDLFRTVGGALEEGLVTLESPDEGDRDDPALLGRLRSEPSFVPLGETPYYGEPELDRILDGYRSGLDDTCVTFPVVALRCLRFLRRLAGGRLLVLSADKGYVHPEALLSRGVPGFSVHGSVSMSVNYHAVAELFRGAGGAAFHARRRQSSLRVCAFASLPEAALPETRYAAHEALEVQGPDDFFSLKKGVETAYDLLAAEPLLALLRLSGCDANLLLRMLPRWLALLPETDEATRQELCRVARRAWEMYLPLGETEDLAFAIGLLFANMDRYAEALDFFERSAALSGPAVETLFNVALCRARLHQLRPALEAVEEALRLEPGYAEARNLRLRLEAALAEGG